MRQTDVSNLASESSLLELTAGMRGYQSTEYLEASEATQDRTDAVHLRILMR